MTLNWRWTFPNCPKLHPAAFDSRSEHWLHITCSSMAPRCVDICCVIHHRVYLCKTRSLQLGHATCFPWPPMFCSPFQMSCSWSGSSSLFLSANYGMWDSEYCDFSATIFWMLSGQVKMPVAMSCLALRWVVFRTLLQSHFHGFI